MSTGEWISLISAITALTAVIVGPLVAWKVAKKQIQASVVSENRQKWIDALRENISDFQTKAKIAVVEDRLANDPNNESVANAESHDLAMKGMTLVINRVVLLINPNEADHSKLLTRMHELLEFCSSGNPYDDKQLDRLEASITSVAQSILKREWERVKMGD